MADDTLQTGTDVIATDHVTTLNGAAVTQTASSPKVQRTKVTFGDDGSSRDASDLFPLPTRTPGSYTTGTITAGNANLVSGAATAGSTVQVTVPDGHGAWTVYLSGTWLGTTLHFQGSPDGINWHALNGRFNATATTNDTSTVLAADPVGGPGASPANYRGNLAGIRFFRVTAGPFTAGDSINVQIATSAGSGAVFLNAALPEGRAAIGLTSPNGYPTRTYSASRTTADAGAPTGVTLVANTRKALLQVHHTAAQTTTKRIRRITVAAIAGAAVGYGYEVYRVTAAPVGGTVMTPQAAVSNDPASTVVVTYNPTTSGAITGAPVAAASIIGATAGHATVTVYEWNPGSDMKPLEIRPGVLEGYTLFVRGTGTVGPDPQIVVEFTEA